VLQAVRFDRERGSLWALDQTLLPHEEREIELRGADDVATALKRLAIRGAPLIGVAAGYGLAIEIAHDPTDQHAQAAAATLRAARPTAVNLSYAVDRVLRAALAAAPGELAEASLAEADALMADELAASAAMGARGADLLSELAGGRGGLRILTHCNTGALAAPGDGTALSLVAELHRRDELALVIAAEARPLLQGARLTVWELARLGVTHELIVDSAAAWLLSRGVADAVLVGCDRVAANGDVANKIGTYSLALAAQAAGVPMVVAGPVSTIDYLCPTGAGIEIEERDPAEVRSVRDELLTLPGTPCLNPAFDVTPAALITALVTDRGVARPVSAETVAALRP
jgi:S-methyl-5-thioribose-1-phosphate isomerase